MPYTPEDAMTERRRPTPEDVNRQVRQHLDSLRAAGVEWLPATGPAPAVPAAAAPPPEPAMSAPSLFDQAPEAPPAAAPVEQRRRELEVLAERVAGCTRCAELAATRTQTVFGVGPVGAELCFVGEAPGAQEDASGVPFVGPAGQLLTRIIVACGLKREEIYICNIIKCRPPGNRPPLPNEAANCREYLDRQLELVQPKFLCALGTTAVKFLLGTSAGITKLRGKFLDYRGTPVMCTFHPSYLLRNPAAKREVWEDMKVLLARMGRTIPGK
jgi:uracil-DNA glycosylase